MKKIDTSNVTSSSRQPLLGRSVTHLQEGSAESLDAIAQKVIGKYTANDVVILYGCINSGSTSGAGNPFSVSAGAVYYNGEIYTTNAVSGNFTGTNVIVGTLTTTYQSGDPVTMTDGTLKNVHQVRTFVISQAASGSGTKDHTAFKQTEKVRSELTQSSYAVTSAWATVTSLTYTTPNDGETRTWMISYTGTIYMTRTTTSLDTEMRIYNSTGATELAYTRVLLDIASAITVTSVYNSAAMHRVMTLAPNTTVVVQAQSSTLAATPTQQKGVFSMVEL